MAAYYFMPEQNFPNLTTKTIDLQGSNNRELDHLVELAAISSKTSMAWISVLDGCDLRLISKKGLDIWKIPLGDSFCRTPLEKGAFFEVLDASSDSRFRESVLVTGPAKIRYYAGAPLINPEDGTLSGILAVMDPRPGNREERRSRTMELLAMQAVSLLKKAEKETWLDQLFSLPLNLICVIERDGRFRRVNKSWEKVLGYSRHELEGHYCFDYIHPDDRASTRKIFEILAASKRMVRHRNRYRTQSGEYCHMEWQAQISGGVIYAVARDITGQLKYLTSLSEQTELAEQNQLLDSVLENMKEGFAIFNTDGRIVRVNKSFCDMVGYSREQLYREKEPFRYWPPELQKGMKKKSRKMPSKDYGGKMIETSLMRKNGERLPVRLSTGRILDSDGRVQYLFSNFQDITGIDKARRELEHVNNLLEKSNEAARIGTWEADLNKGKIFWSRVTRQIHEVPENLSLDIQAGLNFFKEGRSREVMNRAFRRAVKEGIAFDVVEQIVTTSGKELWVRTIATTELKEGRCIRLYGVMQDIDEHKKLLQKLEISLEREKELNAMKSRFISTASHQFRNPLATIMSSTEILERLGNELASITSENNIALDRQRMHLQRIQNQIDRLESILDDTLVLEKSAQGKIRVQPEEFELADYLKNICKDQAEETAYRGRPIKLFLSEKKSRVRTDSDLLRYILVNLLDNAIKYSPGAADPELHVTRRKEGFVLTVKDYGMGIPDHEKEKVFDPFYRCSNACGVKGTGLGLSIVKDISEWLGARIRLESSPGNGSLFSLDLPITCSVTTDKKD